MSSRAASPQRPAVTVAVLAALWLGAGRCAAAESSRPGCDDGKLSLRKDLPGYWGCPVSAWAESPQRLPSVDTVYDPEPAEQICMDRSISYSRTIPNSGAYRPVIADSGEYFYCPPQRWLNNVHHGATVLLYHPCAPLQERLFLSGLARSCLPHYIISPHPQLSKHMPIALVSWGRTLELSTMASLDVCDWLEATTATVNLNGVNKSRKYNLLLIWRAEPHQRQHAHQEEHSTKMKESLRQCCEQTISSVLNGAKKLESLKPMKRETKSRQIRAAIRETQENAKGEDERGRRTGAVQNSTRPVGPPSGNRTLSDSFGSREAPIQPKIDHLNKDPSPRPAAPLRLSMLKRDTLRFGAQKTTHTAVSEAPGLGSRDGVKDSAKKRGSPAQPQLHLNTKAASYLPDTPDCDGCKTGERCECTEDTGAEARASVVKKGLPRTPRTDEAVWAAAALGFLLVLLTLSVLHTRLYRHWRTMPSLYWHDPRQDYDSVADVIRRRLRIAKRRRKRGRRQEYVLLPSSSSSDEHL